MFPTIHTILHWRRDCNRKTHYFYILAVLHIKDVFLWILFTMDAKNSPTGFSVDGGLLYLPSRRSMRSSMALHIKSLRLSPTAPAAACISALRPFGSVSSFVSRFSFIHWFLYSVLFFIVSPQNIIPHFVYLIYVNNAQSLLYKIVHSVNCNMSYIGLY